MHGQVHSRGGPENYSNMNVNGAWVHGEFNARIECIARNAESF